MSFSFDFVCFHCPIAACACAAADARQNVDADDSASDSPVSAAPAVTDGAHPAQAGLVLYAKLTLSDLCMTLPPMLSYTPIRIQRAATDITLARRDLFDARFQILSQDDQEDTDRVETFFDESSDLVKGVYEGGFKTWECSLDLVEVLATSNDTVRGRCFLEIGCGTAMPSCFIFTRLLQEIKDGVSAEGEHEPWTRLHLQDYNDQVLSHMTLPNLILTFARFCAQDELGPLAQSQPGELEVTSELIEAFEAFLERHRIELVFYRGAWQGFEPESVYDVVMTSETVYELSSLPSLLDLLHRACDSASSTCLVACKRIYFGVGGGEHEFRRQAEERGASIKTVWGTGSGDGRDRGVGRTVMSLKWPTVVPNSA